MYCAAILFTCACASTFAQYLTHRPRNRWPGPTANLSPRQQDISYSSTPSSPELKLQELQPYNSKDYNPVLPRGNALKPATQFDTEANSPTLASDWETPAFRRSLQDFDRGIEILRSHFTQEAFADKTGKDFNYIVLVNAIKQLAKEVSRKGWASYYENYQALVRQSIEETYQNPEQVVKNLDCEVIQPLEGLISKIRDIIQHPVVQSVCTSQSACCDSAILVAMSLDPYPNIREAIAALTSAGKAAGIFLNLYADNFETIAARSPYDYLFTAREILRQLVEADAQVYDVVGEGQCS